MTKWQTSTLWQTICKKRSKPTKANIDMAEENKDMEMPQQEAEMENAAVEADAQESAEAAEEAAEKKEETVEDLLAKANEQIADLKDKQLRMMAEFDNFRRRTAKEKLDLQKSAGEKIFVEMLSLVDDFERAQAAMVKTDDIEAVRQGIDLIYQKFVGFLEKHEVKAIETKDADFDTEYHEAITTFPAPTEEQKGKVIDCTQKGYMLGEKVIRYAKVVVGE